MPLFNYSEISNNSSRGQNEKIYSLIALGQLKCKALYKAALCEIPNNFL